jgi:hypothetical protein
VRHGGEPRGQGDRAQRRAQPSTATRILRGTDSNGTAEVTKAPALPVAVSAHLAQQKSWGWSWSLSLDRDLLGHVRAAPRTLDYHEDSASGSIGQVKSIVLHANAVPPAKKMNGKAEAAVVSALKKNDASHSQNGERPDFASEEPHDGPQKTTISELRGRRT